jgi:hypothetical protein
MKGVSAVSSLVLVVVGVLVVAAVLAASALGISGSGNVTTVSNAGLSAGAKLTASRFGKGAAENRPAKIVLAQADGSASRILTKAWFSFVSPDGSKVAVVDSDVNWYTNTRLELFASAGGPSTGAVRIDCIRLYWSPDSSKLACVQFNAASKPSGLLVIDAATLAVTTLAKGFFDPQVSFSPDSTRLAYVQAPKATYVSSHTKLKVIDLATQSVKTVRTGGVAAPAWGPTGIAFATLKPRGRNYTFNVAVVGPDGSGLRRLTRFRPNAQLFGPTPVAWSSDGKRLLAGMQGLDAWTQREAYAVNAVHGGLRLIAHRVSPSALSLDGRYVIGQTGDAESTGLAGSNVVRVPWAGGKKRILLRQAVGASYSG